MMPSHLLLRGDARRLPLADESVDCCLTSPPYWGLRNYGDPRQIGLEATPEEYVAALVDVFREVRRVLRKRGVLWIVIGDCYATGAGSARSPGGKSFGKTNPLIEAGDFPRCQPNRMPLEGLKPKDLIMIPYRLASALQADGWWLRSACIWHKPNAMVHPVKDRPTVDYEHVFLLAKSRRYHYDSQAIKERAKGTNHHDLTGGRYHPPGQTAHGGLRKQTNVSKRRNKRTVWSVPTRPSKGGHPASFPPELIVPCILAGCPKGGTVLDPFSGIATTGYVAVLKGRRYIGLELNPKWNGFGARRLVRAQRPHQSEPIASVRRPLPGQMSFLEGQS
jgi:DNA modification methylase